MIEAHLTALARATRTRGRARRRFLTECRAHLEDLASDVGPAAAVARFGDPVELAAEFDLEVSMHRALRAGWWTAVAVPATGASTLALIHAADPAAEAPALWATTFLVAGQLAAACTGLVLLQSARQRREPASGGSAALLCRRALCAIAAASLTMVAAGAALPGRGSAAVLLAGPALLAVAAATTLRARRSVRRTAAIAYPVGHAPLDDLRAVTGWSIPQIGPLPVALLAAALALGRDLGEPGSSLVQSLRFAGLEAVAVLGAYVLLRRPLALQPSSSS